MSIRSTVESFRTDGRLIRDLDGGVMVSTDCLYPSMSSVVVFVEGGKENFIVHDGLGAIREAAASNVRFERADRIIRPIVAGFGLSVSQNGTITSRNAPETDIGALVLMVANASRDAANALLARYKPVVSRSAKEVVRDILHKRFSEPRIHHRVSVDGESKRHLFDYAVDLENGTRLLLDIVSPDASSVNSAVVASFDIAKRSAGDQKVISRIVYDDAQNWNPQDLALLGAVGRPVKLSRFPDTIDKLLAA